MTDSSTPLSLFKDDSASTRESGVKATFSRSATGAVLWLIPRASKVINVCADNVGAALYEKAKMIESVGETVFP